MKSIQKKDLIPELMDELQKSEAPPNLLPNQDQAGTKKTRKILARILIVGAVIALLAFVFKIDLPVTGSGHVIPSQLLPLEALEPGVIEEVYFKSGQFVQKGDVIAVMINTELERGLEDARLKMNIVRKKLMQLDRSRNYLRLMLNSHQELYRDEIIARSELEKVRLEYTHAQQEYDIYRDEMETLRNKINYHQGALHKMKISAPISGIILTKVENKLGTFVRKGDELCQIANMDNYLLELPINERLIDNVVAGQVATIRFSAYPDRALSGTVIEIQHTAWEKLKKILVTEQVINVMIQIDEKERDLFPIKPGMTAYVKIHSGKISLRWANDPIRSTPKKS
jgi:multidrug resistance efflux pump